jgi:hypothetical protein
MWTTQKEKWGLKMIGLVLAVYLASLFLFHSLSPH